MLEQHRVMFRHSVHSGCDHCERGFTLVELLVTIVILGVLSGVVVFAVQGFSGHASASACAADEHSIVDAQEAYRALNGHFTDEAGLVASTQLRSLSSLHDVTLAGDTYEVVPVGDCATTEAADYETLATTTPPATTPPTTLPASDPVVTNFGKGWVTNGVASISDGVASLTPKTKNVVGSVFFDSPIHSANLHASFVFAGGRRTEGLTFALIDPSASAKALGESGTGLGFAGLPGFAVVLDTAKSEKAEPAAPFVGCAAGSGGFTYTATTDKIADLRDDWHSMDVDVTGSSMTVAVDGEPVLTCVVKLPDMVLVGFTSSSGAPAELHQIAKLSIAS